MLLSATCVFAQDVIVKKDGSTIVSRVLKFSSTEIEYKKFSNLNGPTYTILKSEVRSINYENGEKETFGEPLQTPTLPQESYTIGSTTINPPQTVSDEALMQMVGGNVPQTKIKRLKTLAWTVGPVLAVAGAGCLTAAKTDHSEDGHAYEPKLISGIVLLGSGVIWTSSFLIAANVTKRKNELVINTPVWNQTIPLKNGSILSAGVDIIKDSRYFNSSTLGLGLRYKF